MTQKVEGTYGGGGVVRSRAARGAVAGVGVNQAVGLAADGESGGVEGTLQVGGAWRKTVSGNFDESLFVAREGTKTHSSGRGRRGS